MNAPSPPNGKNTVRHAHVIFQIPRLSVLSGTELFPGNCSRDCKIV